MNLPWKTDRTSGFAVKKIGHGQLGATEGSMLYFLTRDYWRGDGAVVELGSFLGASTSLLGRGIKENPAWKGQVCLHCYDLFEAKYGNMAEFIRDKIDPSFADGASFEHLFWRQVDSCRDVIALHKGDFSEAEWTGGEIEILFADILKTPELNAVCLNRFMDSLVPGHSLLIHQDFHNPANPWIHTAMGRLIEHFEILDPRSDDSALFRLTRPLSREDLTDAARWDDLAGSEKLHRIDALIDRFKDSELTEKYLLLSKARLLGDAGRGPEGCALIEDARQRFGTDYDVRQDWFWQKRCDMIAGRIQGS